MRLFGRRRKADRGLPTYSNEAVIRRIELDAGHERFGRVIHHEPTGTPHPASYRRAYDRRARVGAVDGAVWAVPLWPGNAGTEAGGPAGGEITGGFGGGDCGGGSSCGGGGGCGGGSG
jgi:hypothetical protein